MTKKALPPVNRKISSGRACAFVERVAAAAVDKGSGARRGFQCKTGNLGRRKPAKGPVQVWPPVAFVIAGGGDQMDRQIMDASRDKARNGPRDSQIDKPSQ